MLFTILGPDFESMEVQCSEQSDRITARRADGVTGRIELVREGVLFSGTLVCGEERIPLPSSEAVKEPFYRSLLREVLPFFQTRQPAVPLSETVKLVAFVEEANKLRLEKAGKFE